jgi:hypothetical protein
MTALPALREILTHPVAVDALGGDLAKQTQRSLIGRPSGTDLLYKESVNRKLELLRAELAGPTPAPLKRLLVERVVSCWLHLHHLETVYADREKMNLEVGGYYQRCLTAAHKRYLSAIKPLALVRKRAIPVLQVNIAKKQLNVASVGQVAEAEPTKD